MARKKYKRKRKGIRFYGVTISLTVIGFVAIYFLLRSAWVLFGSSFEKYAIPIFIGSLVLIIILVAIGAIKIGSFLKKVIPQ